MPRDRTAWEQLESRELAPFAMKSADSQGRRHQETEHTLRTRFQRDRDRVIYSRAFRRLEYKTQVFVNHEGDHYRTRLTHSIEVAQIARTMARCLRLNEDLTEAVALVHDVGHTPFGHAGQRALQRKMLPHGGFEHNLQCLRIIDELERRSPDYRGLNLTHEVRASVLKHGTEGVAEFAGAGQPLLEAQVADLADSIAYCCHDLDDGLRSGLLTEEILAGSKLWQATLEEVLRTRPGACGDVRRAQVVRRLVDVQVRDALEATTARLQTVRSVAEVRAAPRRLVGLSDKLIAPRAELQGLLYKHLYRHYKVMREAHKAERLLEQLFDAFVEHPDMLAPDFQQWSEEVGCERAVCDYIAGMTDRYAQDEHRRLFENAGRP